MGKTWKDEICTVLLEPNGIFPNVLQMLFPMNTFLSSKQHLDQRKFEGTSYNPLKREAYSTNTGRPLIMV